MCDRAVLTRIVAGLTKNAGLREDLMQEALLCYWQTLHDLPGQTRSWYLQRCRFHLRHWLKRGRSIDSIKRNDNGHRLNFQPDRDKELLSEYPTNGELFETVSARDLVSTLSNRLSSFGAKRPAWFGRGLRAARDRNEAEDFLSNGTQTSPQHCSVKWQVGNPM